MPDESGQPDLSTATLDELFEEIVRRCRSVVLGCTLLAEEGRSSRTRWDGIYMECVGLARVMEHELLTKPNEDFE